MLFDPEHHQRRSIRLKEYDYSQEGAYFLTICAYQRQSLFGEIIGDVMELNQFGKIVEQEWLQTAAVRPYIVVDDFVVMPNHFHAILLIRNAQQSGVTANTSQSDTVGATCQVAPTRPRGPKSGSIGAILGQFKRIATIRINEIRDTRGAPVWQRNYYEHVIRNESALNDIRSYIQTNPARWAEDQDNPAAVRHQEMQG